MSAANGLPDEITLDELSRLIRILGMLGSASEGEVLAAGTFAAKWVREHQTSWEALLVPEPAPGVSGVVATVDEAAEAAAIQTLTEDAYRRGYKAGLETMAAQMKAQAGMASGQARWTQTFPNQASAWAAAGMAQNSPQSPPGGLRAGAGQTTGQTAQGPVRASAPPHGGYPPGSWQAVAQELLDRHAAGIPGVLRSREETFVADVLGRGFPNLTQAQEAWLRDIAQRSGLGW